MRYRLATFLTAATMLLAAGPARADAIDGSWCSPDGRRLAIEGPTIVTPGGTTMQGDYDRHGFRYTIPANEPGAGAAIVMQLLSETAMRFTAAGAEPQIWRRCPPGIS